MKKLHWYLVCSLGTQTTRTTTHDIGVQCEIFESQPKCAIVSDSTDAVAEAGEHSEAMCEISDAMCEISDDKSDYDLENGDASSYEDDTSTCDM